jgi:hypothetical protein
VRPHALLAAALCCLAARTAAANGAFPDTFSVLVPPEKPDLFVLATNFGLIVSEDGGREWRWACEHGQGMGGYLYQFTAPPGRRMLAIGSLGLLLSDDLGCVWRATPDSGDGAYPYDVFPDAADPMRAVVLAAYPDDKGLPVTAIYESIDGGSTLGRRLYEAPARLELTSVEIARADPRVLFATLKGTLASPARLLRSDDGGAHWLELDPAPLAGVADLRITAIDTKDPRTVYFRALMSAGERLMITRDGGQSFATGLATAGQLTAFLRASDGALYAAVAETDGRGRVHRSDDGGASFAALAPSIHVRGFGERDGVLYAAADWVADGFALGASSNRGDFWRTALRVQEVAGIRDCGDLAARCQTSCGSLVINRVFSERVCGVSAAGDGGVRPPGGAGGGCGCGVGRPARAGAVIAIVAALAMVTLRLPRRRRRGRVST